MIGSNRFISYFTSASGGETATGEPSVDLSESARKTVEDIGQKIHKQIAQHPGVALAIGFSLGVALGCLTKRK